MRIIGQAFYVGAEVSQETLEKLIQRDKDREWNQRMTIIELHREPVEQPAQPPLQPEGENT